MVENRGGTEPASTRVWGKMSDPIHSPDRKAERVPLVYFRHASVVRLTHWVNVVCMTLALMSGLQIFNARPNLYWGQQSNFDKPILSMGAASDDASRGVTQIGSARFDTTGWLGVSPGSDGPDTERGFPRWITLPGVQDLSGGRRWHFFFAWAFVINGAIYLLYSLLSRHVARDLLPRAGEWGAIPHAIAEHARLRFPRGEEARHYNILQKLTYLIVIFILLPAMVLAGLAMSPGMDAGYPFLLDLFGGRQSARTVHFIIAWLLVLFVAVHILMVILSGFFNNMRSMITGRYAIEPGKIEAEEVGDA